MEKAQCMRLHELREVHNATELGRGWRNLHGQQSVAGFGRRHEMTHGTDAADPSRDRWHLREWSTFTELFESTKLSDVKTSVLNLARIVQMDSDLRMAFNASDRIYDDFFSHGLGSKPRKIREIGLLPGYASAGAVAPFAAPAVHADGESDDEKRKARYRESEEVKTYYRVNSYPKQQ